MFDWLHPSLLWLLVVGIYTLAIFSSTRALLHTRTAQGAAAWVLGLMLMPVLTLPLYWVFGHTKFQGYVHRRQSRMAVADRHLHAREALDSCLDPPEGVHADLHLLARRLGAGGFTRGNRLELLIDADATYTAMLRAIAQAQNFILIQFYIFRADDIGRRFQQALIERARAGVTVCFLYDHVGSGLPRSFLRTMTAAGICCHRFDPGRKGQRLQLNFRNHRKIIVVDGGRAFVGGCNIGDDYLGGDTKVGAWRDTHLSIHGPGAAQAQLAFFKDWYWATDELPKIDFPIEQIADEPGHLLVWHTGPADPQPECLLMWLELINGAHTRIWIATPYFVPPEPVLHALRLALVRGVEVRLLVPGWNDNRLVDLASQVHLSDMAGCGAEIHRWCTGFMHQKVALFDDSLAMVGSVNLDHRSIFINFEIAALATAPAFVDAVEKMLSADWERSRRVSLDEFRNAGFLRRLACRAANLCSPML